MPRKIAKKKLAAAKEKTLKKLIFEKKVGLFQKSAVLKVI